jgi:hypothetical protein
MSIKHKVLAAAATLTVAGGLSNGGDAARGRGDSAVRPALHPDPQDRRDT